MRGGITRAAARAISVWRRDGGVCVYCGGSAEVVDHVLPISKGGPNVKENEVLACRRCNFRKSNKLTPDWITRGLFWLLQQGEDLTWADNIIEGEIGENGANGD